MDSEKAIEAYEDLLDHLSKFSVVDSEEYHLLQCYLAFMRQQQHRIKLLEKELLCRACNGSGRVDSGRCRICVGSGVVVTALSVARERIYELERDGRVAITGRAMAYLRDKIQEKHLPNLRTIAIRFLQLCREEDRRE